MSEIETAAETPVDTRPDTPSDGVDEPVDAAQIPPVVTRRRRPDKTTVAMILILGLGIMLVVRGLLVGITGDDRANLPEYIESVDPVTEAVQVLNQSNVFVDLATGYTGVLVIDGIEIETVNVDELGRTDVEPGQQVELPPVTRFEPGNSTLTFTPSATAPITQFGEGEHTAEVIYWRADEGRQRARSFTWTFNVV